MDAKLLRSVGITVGAVTLAGALAISQMGREPTPVEPDQAAPPSSFVGAEPTDTPVFETASAETPPPAAAPVSFLVRFHGSGPLGQAQRLAERGRATEAGRAVQSALLRQSAFRGLCFDRFTIGGAEMVLRSCASISAADHAQAGAQYLARLRNMSAVAYAEMNATADPAQPR
jgi:hypothetical protein